MRAQATASSAGTVFGLGPPLLLALDEIGNLAPLPSLPVLMAEGGGTGITTMRSSQRSTRRVPIMPPDVIRTLPYGTALLMLRAAPPIVTRMREWGSR